MSRLIVLHSMHTEMIVTITFKYNTSLQNKIYKSKSSNPILTSDSKGTKSENGQKPISFNLNEKIKEEITKGWEFTVLLLNPTTS